jgi:hypothetical protein
LLLSPQENFRAFERRWFQRLSTAIGRFFCYIEQMALRTLAWKIPSIPVARGRSFATRQPMPVELALHSSLLLSPCLPARSDDAPLGLMLDALAVALEPTVELFDPKVVKPVRIFNIRLQGNPNAIPARSIRAMRSRIVSSCCLRKIHRHCPMDTHQEQHLLDFPNQLLRYECHSIDATSVWQFSGDWRVFPPWRLGGNSAEMKRPP